MIKNFHLMQYFCLENADLIKNKSFVSFYEDIE